MLATSLQKRKSSELGSKMNVGDEDQVTYLMEQLLDEQEKVAQLQKEVHALRSAPHSNAVRLDILTADTSMGDLETLQALRESLLSSLERVEERIIKQRLAASPQRNRVANDIAVERDALVTDVMQRIKGEAIQFKSFAQCEDIHKACVKAMQDGPRTFTAAHKRLLQLTQNFALIALLPQPLKEIPSFCEAREWRSQFQKALMEMVVAFESSDEMLMTVHAAELGDLVRHEGILVELLRLLQGRSVVPKSLEQWKRATSQKPVVRVVSTSPAVLDRPLSRTRSPQGSPMLPPRPLPKCPPVTALPTKAIATRTSSISPNTLRGPPSLQTTPRQNVTTTAVHRTPSPSLTNASNRGSSPSSTPRTTVTAVPSRLVVSKSPSPQPKRIQVVGHVATAAPLEAGSTSARTLEATAKMPFVAAATEEDVEDDWDSFVEEETAPSDRDSSPKDAGHITVVHRDPVQPIPGVLRKPDEIAVHDDDDGRSGSVTSVSRRQPREPHTAPAAVTGAPVIYATHLKQVKFL